jgi:hypothetical protein
MRPRAMPAGPRSTRPRRIPITRRRRPSAQRSRRRFWNRCFGPVNAIPFTATDVRDPKRTRAFANLADMAEEQKNVRVWGGVHYRFALRTSEGVGAKLMAYMIENTLKPVR